MNNDLFNELTKSIREAAAIHSGKKKPSRVFHVKAGDIPDVPKIRQVYNLSQEKFAALLGISVHTLRNWEQGKRVPEGPARILLKVATKHPEVLLDVSELSGA